MPDGVKRGKLLIAATIPETITAFLLPYAEHLRARGWQVDGLARNISASPACREAFDSVHDVAWSRQPLDPRNLLRIPAAVRDVVARGEYDLVHVHTPVAGFITRFALRSRPRSCTVIYTAHGFHFQKGGAALKNAVFTALERVAARWTDQLIVINSEDEAAARRLALVDGARLHHLPGIGIDTARFSEATAGEVIRLRQELELPAAARLITMIAELIPRKRHADLLHAIALLQDETVHLLLAGAGPLRSDLMQLAAALGLEGRVHFLGFRNDIPAVLASSEVLVLPSLQEGLPVSILEAMSMRVPVIGTRIRGVTDLLSGGAGMLVPPREPAALAAALRQLLADAELRAAVTATAAERVSRYDIRSLLEWHQEFYEALLEVEGGLADA